MIEVVQGWGSAGEKKLEPGSKEWNEKRDTLLLDWKKSKEVLEAAKNSEMMARKAAADFVFPVETRKEGINNHELGHGYVFKVGHKLNYKLDKSNDRIMAAEEAAEKIGNEGPFWIERLIKWTPELSVSEYKKLNAAASEGNDTAKKVKTLVDGVLSIEPGSPSAEIKEPKATLNNQ